MIDSVVFTRALHADATMRIGDPRRVMYGLGIFLSLLCLCVSTPALSFFVVVVVRTGRLCVHALGVGV